MIITGGLGIISLFFFLVVFVALISLIFAYRKKNDPLKWYRIRVLWLYIIFPTIGVITNDGLLVSMVFFVFLFHIILWCIGIKIWYSNSNPEI
ncbi:MAG: hypothetical protein COA42_15555 [Alteromonadaceae bacterium]|nr:MAG: hypothetical protein COA42_15555 [Alteromonadaceae bacterium]